MISFVWQDIHKWSSWFQGRRKMSECCHSDDTIWTLECCHKMQTKTGKKTETCHPYFIWCMSAVLKHCGSWVEQFKPVQLLLTEALFSCQITIEKESGQDVTAPKHGKIDPNNAPHVGGNQWAGGTGNKSRSFVSLIVYVINPNTILCAFSIVRLCCDAVESPVYRWQRHSRTRG